MGSPALATDRVKRPAAVRASTRIGSSAEPWVRALASRFEKSCAMRAGSQSTGSVEREGGLDRTLGRRRLQLGDDLLQHGLERHAAALREKPPPRRPRAKSSTLSISADMRAVLPCISRTISAASSSSPRRCSRCRPPMTLAQRIAQVVAQHRDELLAQPSLLAFAGQRRLARDQPLDGVEVKGDEIRRRA